MPLNVEKVKWRCSGTLVGPVGPGRMAAAGEAFALRPGKARIEAAAGSDDFAAWVLGPAAKVPPIAARAGLQAVLFDLDGVLVDTAEFHYLAWKRLAEELGVSFDRAANQGFRGVGRMECLEKLLGEHARFFAGEEKRLLADRKNAYYLERVRTLTGKDVAPGVTALVAALKGSSVRLAVVSASRNARLVLDLLGILDWFDVVIDGADVTRGKPDPEGFLLAAERLRVWPERCVVVEDAESGARAAVAAGMGVLGIGEGVNSAAVRVDDLRGVSVKLLESLCGAVRAPRPRVVVDTAG